MDDEIRKSGNNTKRPPTEAQKSRVKEIKHWLKLAFDESHLDLKTLLIRIESCYDVHINRGTLKRLFDENDLNIDFTCLITVATYFGFDLNDLLLPTANEDEFYKSIAKKWNMGYSVKQRKQSDPDEEIHPFIEIFKNVQSKFPVLEDDGYTGDFVGYILPPTKGDSDIEQPCRFDLRLEKDRYGIMRATAVREVTNKRRKKADHLKYTGVPLFAKAYKAVIMFLTDEKNSGEFYFLSFGFEKYRTKDGLVFRQGLAVTGEAFNRATLVAQNFLIFEHGLSKADLPLVPGLLKVPSNEICISVEDTAELAASYPEVRRFLDEMKDEMTNRKKDMYILREDNILSLETLNLSQEERLRVLLLLKSKASAEYRHYYKASGTYSHYAKNVLMSVESEER